MWYNEVVENECVFIYRNRPTHLGRTCSQQTKTVNQVGRFTLRECDD